MSFAECLTFDGRFRGSRAMNRHIGRLGSVSDAMMVLSSRHVSRIALSGRAMRSGNLPHGWRDRLLSY